MIYCLGEWYLSVSMFPCAAQALGQIRPHNKLQIILTCQFLVFNSIMARWCKPILTDNSQNKTINIVQCSVDECIPYEIRGVSFQTTRDLHDKQNILKMSALPVQQEWIPTQNNAMIPIGQYNMN